MDLQDFLLHELRSWQPTAPLVVARSKGDITLTWRQEQFSFLKQDLLYRLEKNNKLPKWVVVYSGGKTLKRIDNLAPSHPHRFRLKVILRASAVPFLAQKALQHYGDERTVREKLRYRTGFVFDTVHARAGMDRIRDNVHARAGMDRICDNIANVTINDEEPTGETQNATTAWKSKACEKQRWIESAFSEETWTNTDSEGTSSGCFCMAVKCGYIKQVQCMLEERPALIGVVNASSGFTPLATAVRTGDVDTVSYLLSMGAELEQPSAAGQTALHIAALRGDAPLVELLIDEGASFNARDWNGLRVEHYAVDSGSLAVLRLVLDRGGDVHVRDNTGWTPLFRALCQGANTEIVEELLTRGSDVDVVDNAGLPLASAAKLLSNRHGRSRVSILRLVDPAYPQEKGLANFTRITKKIYNVHKLLKLT